MIQEPIELRHRVCIIHVREINNGLLPQVDYTIIPSRGD